jgi:hypothetical protein
MNVGIGNEVEQFNFWEYKKIKIQKNIISVVRAKNIGNVTV